MTTYFQHLKFPFDLNMEDAIRSSARIDAQGVYLTKLPDGVLDQRLVDALTEVGILLPPRMRMIFVVKAGVHMPPHSDKIEAKINISYGAAGSRMFWWKSSAPETYLKTDVNSNYWQVPPSSCKFLASTRIGVTLLDAYTYHSVLNRTNEDRYTLSMGVKGLNEESMTFEEAKERLAKFAV